MATLQEKLNDDWKAAMRSGDTLRRDTLSGLRATVKNEEIQARAGGTTAATAAATGAAPSMDDATVIKVIEREAKKRRDAIEEYERANRPDRAEAEQAELRVLQEYLPQQLSDAELEDLARQAVNEVCAERLSDLGKVMPVLMPRVQGRADGRRVNAVVRQLLNQPGQLS